MPRDFKQFLNENENVIEENKETAEDLNKILNKYKDMDQNTLLSHLFQEASKLKREGKLDSATLNNISSNLAPFLNNEQKQMLNELVNAINEQK